MIDDNYHYMDERYRKSAGDFEDYESALDLAQKITFESLVSNEASTAAETYEKYQSFGKDPFIMPIGDAPKPEEDYSAWDTAKMLAELLEVERLNQAEGSE